MLNVHALGKPTTRDLSTLQNVKVCLVKLASFLQEQLGSIQQRPTESFELLYILNTSSDGINVEWITNLSLRPYTQLVALQVLSQRVL